MDLAGWIRMDGWVSESKIGTSGMCILILLVERDRTVGWCGVGAVRYGVMR